MIYSLENDIATLTFDDGKANVVGHQFLDDINTGLDRAEAEQAKAVIIKGRAGMFSGGFDLGEFKKGPEQGLAMVNRGFELLIRLYGYPLPLIGASTGHSIAMGAFILMACDSRVGCSGDFKLSLPETAIGMELPPILLELARSRISKLHLTRVALQSEVYTPEMAVDAGFIDEVVPAQDLDLRTQAIALTLSQLPKAQYATNKLAIRNSSLKIMRDSVDELIQRSKAT